MKGFARLFLAALLMVAAAAPAYSWEFTMKGEAEYRYRYWTRTGNDDIFGHMDGSDVYLGVNHLLTFPTTGTSIQPRSGIGQKVRDILTGLWY